MNIFTPLMNNPCTRRADNTIYCQDTTNSLNLPPTALGEEKELAILFLDIRNFSQFMESRSAYDVVYVIHKLFVMFGESIKEAGGRIIETAGDSIYAVFGMNSTVKDAVKSSVDAAQAIFNDLEIFNTTFAKPGFGLNFEIGIGINQGKVVVGQFDLDYNQHLTVMGLPVNIASRLQSETKKQNNNLLIAEQAYALLDKQDINHEQRTIYLRGITGPQQIRLMGQSYTAKPKTDLPDDLAYHLAVAG